MIKNLRILFKPLPLIFAMALSAFSHFAFCDAEVGNQVSAEKEADGASLETQTAATAVLSGESAVYTNANGAWQSSGYTSPSTLCSATISYIYNYCRRPNSNECGIDCRWAYLNCSNQYPQVAGHCD